MSGSGIDKLSELLKKKVPEWEIYSIKQSSFSVEAKEGVPELRRAGEVSGFAIRLTSEKGSGFSYCSSEDNFEESIEEAIAFSRYRGEKNYRFTKEIKNGILRGAFFDKGYHDIEHKVMESYIKRAADSARSLSGRIKKVRKSIFNKRYTKVHIRNSYGIDLWDERSDFYLFQEVIAEDGNDSTTSWEIEFSHYFKDIDPERAGIESAKNAVGLLHGTRLVTGDYPAVLKNSQAAELVSILGNSFLSESIFKNRSKLKGMEGKKVFSELLTLVHSGGVKEGWNSLAFDGEGVPAEDRVLVEKGLLKSFLYDNFYGEFFKHPSTGNSKRDEYTQPPKQDIINLYVKPGDSRLEELIKTANRGVFITGLMGVHTINPVTGDFSVGAEGYLIDRGEITTPFRGVTMSGNLFEIFKSLEGVGNDLRFFFSAGSPSLLLKKVTIGGI